ncbi:hypothetical protein WT09_15355 [Burkholderia stagnalis]|nr:hypothetical protein WT07_01405 [Burkholderia stagnalis]KVN15348.1 hypothetical protein WT09_15355 [Burkholderia stagnalis]KWE12047.1 hypothetical protein WT47_05930 [Burkholderia stagnalis]
MSLALIGQSSIGYLMALRQIFLSRCRRVFFVVLMVLMARSFLMSRILRSVKINLNSFVCFVRSGLI